MEQHYKVKVFKEIKHGKIIYVGSDLSKATNIFDEYYANNPHDEIVILNKYGLDIKSANIHEEDDDEYGYCPECRGSGEGMWDGSTCRVCGGSGELKHNEY